MFLFFKIGRVSVVHNGPFPGLFASVQINFIIIIIIMQGVYRFGFEEFKDFSRFSRSFPKKIKDLFAGA